MTRAVLVLALALVPTCAHAQTTWFSSLWTSGTYPQGNWAEYDATNEGTFYTLARVPGGCPDGTDSVSVQFIPVGTHTQFNYGWGIDPPGFAAFASSNSAQWYLKYRIKPNATVAMIGNPPENNFYMKFIMFGADATEGQRFITDLIDNGSVNTTTAIRSMRNVDGATRRDLVLGQWNHVIQGYRLETSGGADDGILNVWSATSGTLNVGTPNVSTTGQDLAVNAGRTGFAMGRFTQTTLGIGGSFGYELCNVVLTDTFDPNWPTPGTPPPTTAYRYRFRLP